MCICMYVFIYVCSMYVCMYVYILLYIKLCVIRAPWLFNEERLYFLLHLQIKHKARCSNLVNYQGINQSQLQLINATPPPPRHDLI